MEPDCSAPADGTEWVTCMEVYATDIYGVVAATVGVAVGIAILFAGWRVVRRTIKIATGER